MENYCYRYTCDHMHWMMVIHISGRLSYVYHYGSMLEEEDGLVIYAVAIV